MTDSSPSNVLFVVLDTVRKDHLTPYGYDRPTTPELSSFAAEATVFDDAVAPAPWTLPVHASMFTGRYPSDHGADQGSPYMDDVATLASILSAAGYETACYSSNAWITPYTNLTHGFDEQDSFFEVMPGDFLSGPLASAWQRINDSDRLRSLASRFVRAGAKIHARLASGDGADSKTPSVIDRTKSFVEDADGEWFAFVNLMDAHLPYYPPAEYREQFAPDVDPADVCQNSKEFNSGARPIDEAEWDAIRGLYDAEIAHMDAELGRLFAWLRETGRWEETMVVVCADHGELHGEHDLYGHEFALYEQLINVPLLVDHRSLTADRRGDLVELLDLYHTILDATGAAPERATLDAVPVDPSRSLLSDRYRSFDEPGNDPGQRALAALDADGDYAFVEYAQPVIELHHLEQKAAEAGIELPPDHRGYAAMQAARGSTAKYVRADRIPDEGFDLAADPEEQTPLDPDDHEGVATARRALELFGTELAATWETDADPADPEEVLADVDADAQERLRDLGYLE